MCIMYTVHINVRVLRAKLAFIGVAIISLTDGQGDGRWTVIGPENLTIVGGVAGGGGTATTCLGKPNMQLICDSSRLDR